MLLTLRLPELFQEMRKDNYQREGCPSNLNENRRYLEEKSPFVSAVVLNVVFSSVEKSAV